MEICCFFFESHSNSPLAQPAGHIVYCNTSTFEDELASPVLGMRRQNRIKIHRCKCDCVSRRIYIRTLGTDELLSDWGRWPITLEICLLTFGKVSTSKFKAAIGQIWDVGMMICPLAHYFIIIFFLLHLPACTQNSSFWWERQRDESTAEQPSTDFCLTFTNTTTFYWWNVK